MSEVDRFAVIEQIINTLQPILCRPGGKKLLKKKIVNQIPPHRVYVEPFMGTGAVFFDKEPAEVNVLGDNDKKLMKFYKDIQKLDRLTCDVRRDKSKWERIVKKKNKNPCDYAYLVKASYGCVGERFNDLGEGGSNSIQNYDKQINFLKNARLIHGDYKDMIRKYDSKDTFFYLDPPYHELSCGYPDGSCNVTPQEVFNSIKNIKGKFILSYNNHSDVRKIFCEKYKCKVVKTRYTGNKIKDSSKQMKNELLIKNF